LVVTHVKNVGQITVDVALATRAYVSRIFFNIL
jgi:hypothetical protein